MAATVIDSLLVTLGLDPSGYKKGAAEAAKSTKAVSESVKVSSEGMVKALEEVGRSVAVLFLGFESVTGLGKFLAGLNNTSANLGLVSKNLGLSVHEVEVWGNAVKLMGGTAEEAQAGLLSLNKQLVDFKIGASGPSALVTLLQRAGVDLYDLNGNIRKTPDLLKDLAKAYEGVNQATARARLADAGVSENVINLLLQEKSAREATLAQAERNSVATKESTDEALKLRQAWQSVQEKIEAVGQTFNRALLPPIQKLLAFLDAMPTKTSAMNEGFKAIGSTLSLLVDLVVALAAAFNALFKVIPLDKIIWLETRPLAGLTWLLQKATGTGPAAAGREPVRGTITRDEGNNNPGNIKAVGDQARDERGMRKFATMAEGIAAIGHQIDLYRGRGINTITGIVDTYAPAGPENSEENRAAYKERMRKATGKSLTEQLTDADRMALIRSIIEQEGVVTGAAKISALLNGSPGALMAARGGAATPGLDRGQAAGNTSTTTVTVGPVTVNTQATDANGIARDIGGALQRKGVLAQADSGMS